MKSGIMRFKVDLVMERFQAGFEGLDELYMVYDECLIMVLVSLAR